MYSLALLCPKLRFLCMLRCCSLPLWNLASNCILPFFQIRNHHDTLFRVGCCLGLYISALKEKKNLTTISNNYNHFYSFFGRGNFHLWTDKRTNEWNEMNANVITALFYIILKSNKFRTLYTYCRLAFPRPIDRFLCTFSFWSLQLYMDDCTDILQQSQSCRFCNGLARCL